ncbi:60S ribosomal protein L31 [Tulasnella sp. 417]|nr:60S ribosomal protein L31 [Tulasnella sp. 417]
MAPTPKQGSKKRVRTALKDVVTREYTVHLQKCVRDKQFKRRTPTAIKGIILFAQRHMGTKDVRIDPKLNEAVWAKGVRYPPRRIRIRLERSIDGLLPGSSIGPLPACGAMNAPQLSQFNGEHKSSGKRNDDEDAKEKLYTYATHVPGITNFHGLENEVIDAE